MLAAFVESRYCVKLYQDECYPTFCNTTNTWKMTCPCRGDLCNGPNTARETEAFTLLKRLSNKTSISSRKKIKGSSNIIKRDVDEKIEDQIEEIGSTESLEDTVNEIVGTRSDSENTILLNEIQYKTESTGSVKETEAEQLPTPVSIEQEESIAETEIKSIDPTQKSLDEQNNDNNKDCEENKSTTVKTTIAIIKQTENPLENEETRESKVQDTSNVNDIKPSEQLPTAEALQQNATPVTNEMKPTEQITSDVTHQTIIDITTENLTPKPTPAQKGDSNRNTENVLFLVYIYMFYYYTNNYQI